MIATMQADGTIQQSVLDEFLWDPEVQAPDVGVEVDQGVVTLTGTVSSYSVKMAAEDAAHRVEGVRAVANDLDVRTPMTHNDTDIAKAAAEALKAIQLLPKDAIEVTVDHGRVTLSGDVEWAYQRKLAADRVRYLRGVRDVNNHIVIKQPAVSAHELDQAIKQAFMRAAEVDADHVRVSVRGGQVTLAGKVRSWAEKQAAANAAWRARGVTMVINDIAIGP
jgi:osmotically-inducible protein OsmY